MGQVSGYTWRGWEGWGGLLGNGILEAETQCQPHRAPGPGAGLGEVRGGAQPRLTWQRG